MDTKQDQGVVQLCHETAVSDRRTKQRWQPRAQQAPGGIRKTEQDSPACASGTHDLRQVHFQGVTGQAHSQAEMPDWPPLQAHLLVQRGRVA